ncbi:hypothetical protein GCM10027044_15520 [Hymenobacter ruber]
MAKWNTNGGFVWAQRVGGADRDEATAITINGPNVYVAGFFYSSSVVIGNTTLNNAGGSNPRTGDAFIVKFTDAGTSSQVVWAQRAGGNDDDSATGIAVAGGNVYATGWFLSPAMTFGNITLTNSGFYDMFVTKLTDNGTTSSFTWARQSNGLNLEQATAIAVNGVNVYVVGTFSGGTIATFGNITLTNTNSSGDVFVSKLTDTGTSGSFTWTLRGVAGYANAVAVNGANVYVAGAGVFVSKFTDAGATSVATWTQSTTGSGDNVANAIAVNGTSVYVAGRFTTNGLRVGNATLYNTGTIGGDVFVTKLTDAGASGGFTWAQSAGGTSNDFGAAIAVNGTSIYVGGFVSRPASFGSYVVTSSTTLSIGFLASLTDNGALATTSTAQLQKVQVYPNPAHYETLITIPAIAAGNSATITLVDALGRSQRQYTVVLPAQGLHHCVDLTGLSGGVYSLQVQAGATKLTQRLVVN